jgi:hypothetical protein
VTSGDPPLWTPGGEIYFVKGPAGDILSVQPDGNGRSRVTTDMEVGAFAVSPDGTLMAIYDVAGDSMSMVPGTGKVWDPAWRPE